jgi:hypothetical protein
MPIERLLAGSERNRKKGEILTAAFRRALRSLSLVDRNDPPTESIASKIIEIGATGVRDPAEICNLAIKRLRISKAPRLPALVVSVLTRSGANRELCQQRTIDAR